MQTRRAFQRYSPAAAPINAARHLVTPLINTLLDAQVTAESSHQRGQQGFRATADVLGALGERLFNPCDFKQLSPNNPKYAEVRRQFLDLKKQYLQGQSGAPVQPTKFYLIFSDFWSGQWGVP